MNSNHTKNTFISYEIKPLSSGVNTSQTNHTPSSETRHSKMAELACKLAEDDISKLIQEARQLARQNK